MILIVDDEAENRESLREVLEREGWTCRLAASAPEALTTLRDTPEIQLLITDLKMPGGMNGLELLQSARLIRPEVQRLLVTAFGTIEDTVTAMRAGAFDVLTKPLKVRALKETVRRLLAQAPQVQRVHSTTQSHQFSESYGRVMELLRKAAPSQASVLFVGESGSGKSYLAKTLHQCSERKDGPFVALNCAAIPSELLESELFGYEKGAFTGATQSRDGKILAAHKGTLLLDEIADLSPPLQAKLLQFIQDRKFFKLGSNKETFADVRIVAATNRSLSDLVKESLFREDLLYRLRVIEIPVPPLRERLEDLLWLIPLLMDSLCEKNSLPPIRLTHEALARLWKYPWPGNIRELENVLESALVLSSPEERQTGFLSERSLPPHVQGTEETSDLPPLTDLATLERKAVEQALIAAGGNRRLAAGLLGISERTLYRVLDRSSGENSPST